MIKRLKPINIRPGDLVYCGHTGKKKWRRLELRDIVSAWRYSLHFDGWSISAGSGCEFLVKQKRRLPHGF